MDPHLPELTPEELATMRRIQEDPHYSTRHGHLLPTQQHPHNSHDPSFMHQQHPNHPFHQTPGQFTDPSLAYNSSHHHYGTPGYPTAPPPSNVGSYTPLPAHITGGWSTQPPHPDEGFQFEPFPPHRQLKSRHTPPPEAAPQGNRQVTEQYIEARGLKKMPPGAACARCKRRQIRCRIGSNGSNRPCATCEKHKLRCVDQSEAEPEDVKRDLRVVHPAADASHTQHSLGTSHPLFPVTRNKATLARVFA